VKVSIGVCTWNRCELLRKGLEAMTYLAMSSVVNWEVVGEQGLKCGLELPAEGNLEFLGMPGYLWRQALGSEFRYRIGRPFRRPEVRIQDLAEAAQARGQMSSYGARCRASTGADRRGATAQGFSRR